MSKISIDGFQELFEAVRGMRMEFEGMVTSMRAAGGAASGLASQMRGPTQSANVPIHKGKGVYRPTSNGNVMTFPNAQVDTDAMRQQVEEANAAQQTARGGTRFRRPNGVGGIDLSTMISGGDSYTTVARGAARMQSYNKGLTDTSKLMESLEKSTSADAKIIQQALQQSQGKIGSLQERISSAKSGMYDSSGNQLMGDADFKRALKKLADLTEKQVKELEKSNKLEESAKQLGFGGGSGGGGGFIQGISDRFGGLGRAGMMGAAGLAHMAQSGFNAFGSDYRNQSGLALDTARNIGSVAGGTFSRKMMANDTDPANLVRFYGDAMLGKGFASRSQYVGLAGTQNANAEALRSSGLRSSAMGMDMGASLAGLARNTMIGAAGGAIGGSIIPGLGTVAGGIVGGIGGLASGIGGVMSAAPEFMRARGITLGGLFDGNVGSAERMRYATGKSAEMFAHRNALEEADMGRFQDSVYGLGQIREAIGMRKAATSSIGGMATDGLSMMGQVSNQRYSGPAGDNSSKISYVGDRMRAAAARAAAARAGGRMPAGMSDFGNVASRSSGPLVDGGRGGRETPFSVPQDGPMQLSGFGSRLANEQMNYSMYAQSANMLSGALGRKAGTEDTMSFVRLGRAGVGSQDQIAGNLMSLASSSNSAGLENLKKIFGEAFAAGLKGSGFIQQFASLTQNLSSAMGVTNSTQVAGSLRAGTRMMQGFGDTASVGMGSAALGMQQFNNFSSQSGGVPGVMRAFGVAMGGGTLANGGSSVFGMNAEQLGQTSRELGGSVDKMGSRTQMMYRNLRSQGMSDKDARAALKKQIQGASEMTSVPLAGVYNARNPGKKFEDQISRLKAMNPDSEEFKNTLASIGMAGEQVEGLGREGSLALVQNLLGTDSGGAMKAINREIAAGNSKYADPLNKKKFAFQNSLTEATQGQRSSAITPDEYKKFLGLGTSPVMARVNGQMRALTGDLLSTPEGKAALATVSRDDLVAATRNSMTEGITESAVYIKYLDPVAVRQFTDVFRNSGVDVSAPRTGQAP